MSERKLLPLLAALLLWVPLLHAARVFTVTGVVRAPFAEGRLVVAHDEITGFMPAMTMGFEVPAPARAAAAELKPGERIRFSLEVDEAHAWASHFRVIGARADASRTEPAASPAVRRLHVGDTVPEFALVDEKGRPLTRAALGDRLTLVTFIFTRCPVPEFCPLMARRYGELQRSIKAEPALSGHVRLLSVTLDPTFDQPAVLKAYGRAVGADPAVWQFATGPEAEVGALVKAFSVYTERNGVTLDHTLCTALLDRDGRVVELWRGNGWQTTEVLAALTKAAAR